MSVTTLSARSVNKVFFKKGAIAPPTNPSLSIMKKGIWAYFILLIFEGALRKWVFPGLSTPLLVVRDPIAIWLVLTAWHRNMLPSTFYISGMVICGLVGLVTAISLGHGNVPVALYGARTLLFHFPLMFVMGSVLTREDIIKIGRVFLIICIPMAILTGLQFYSPQSAWVNRGVGGDFEGAGFSGALGYFRPPGTFSFTNGNAQFFSISAGYIVYFWFSKNEINRLLLIAATIALLIAVPFSISRTLVWCVVGVLLFAVVAISQKPQHAGKLIQIGIVGFIAIALIGNASFFQTALEALTSRYTSATESEGGFEGVFMDRYLGGMFGALSQTSTIPFFGFGTGKGTNVGSMLLTGNTGFLISEAEWGRLIGEMGPLVGIAVIFLRMSLCVKITLAAFHKLRKGDLLPWFLLCFALITIPQSQWAQPTSLGFSTLIGGLILASLKRDKTIILKNRS
jgi:hypothetical protein